MNIKELLDSTDKQYSVPRGACSATYDEHLDYLYARIEALERKIRESGKN